MTTAQKVIKYFALAFAIFLIVSIITAILNVIFGLSNVLKLRKETQETITELSKVNIENKDFTTLDIELSYTNLTIKNGENFEIETNNSNIEFNNKNNILQIKDINYSWFAKNNTTDLVLYIPKDLELEKIKIEAGFGTINIESLNAKKLSFELGAGKTEIKELNVTEKAEIEGGAGNVIVKSGKINDLDFDMGVGETEIVSKLTGKSDVDAGVGNVKIILKDSKENYSFKLNKGLGTVKLDGKDISGDGELYGNGENYIEIDGGIGNINVDFEV